MKGALSCKIEDPAISFPKSLFCVISTIIQAYRRNISIVTYNRSAYSKFSSLVNLQALNVFLKKEYSITLYDTESLDFKIISVDYGNDVAKIDITAGVMDKYYKEGILYIPATSVMNLIGGDPTPHRSKKIYLQYSIAGQICSDSYGEIIREDIVYDLSQDACSVYNFTTEDSAVNLEDWSIQAVDLTLYSEILESIYKDCSYKQFASYFDELENNSLLGDRSVADYNGERDHRPSDADDSNKLDREERDELLHNNSDSSKADGEEKRDLQKENKNSDSSKADGEEKRDLQKEDSSLDNEGGDLQKENKLSHEEASGGESTRSTRCQKILSSMREKALQTQPPIYLVYFISCIGDYLRIVEQQLQTITTSGLYKAMKHMICFVTLHKADVEVLLRKYDPESKCKYVSSDMNLYEKFAINNYKYCINEEDYYLCYFHSKSVTHCQNSIYDLRRKSLDYYTLAKFKLSLRLLDKYDSVGCAFSLNPKLHFSGNYWWAKSSHLKTLQNVNTRYLSPEFYICSNPASKYASLCQHTNDWSLQQDIERSDSSILASLTEIAMDNPLHPGIENWY